LARINVLYLHTQSVVWTERIVDKKRQFICFYAKNFVNLHRILKLL